MKKPPQTPGFLSTRLMEQKITAGSSWMTSRILWIPPRLAFNSFHFEPSRLGCQVETRILGMNEETKTVERGLIKREHQKHVNRWLLKVDVSLVQHVFVV